MRLFDQNTRAVFSRLWRLMRAYRKFFWIAMLTMAVTALTEAAFPRVLGYILDHGFGRPSGNDVAMLNTLSGETVAQNKIQCDQGTCVVENSCGDYWYLSATRYLYIYNQLSDELDIYQTFERLTCTGVRQSSFCTNRVLSERICFPYYQCDYDGSAADRRNAESFNDNADPGFTDRIRSAGCSGLAKLEADNRRAGYDASYGLPGP